MTTDQPHDARGLGLAGRIVWSIGVAHQPVILGAYYIARCAMYDLLTLHEQPSQRFEVRDVHFGKVSCLACLDLER